MGGHDYNNALTIFFISYGLAEPATNVMLKRLTPRVFFTGIILLWGLIMTLMGLVENKAALLACRFLLGLAEAGLFPGMVTFLSWPNTSKLTFNRCELLPVLLVQALRARFPRCHLLLCCSIGRLIRWFARRCDRADGRHRWQRRLGLDLHHRGKASASSSSSHLLTQAIGYRHHVRWRFLLVDGLRLARHRSLPLSGRPPPRSSSSRRRQPVQRC